MTQFDYLSRALYDVTIPDSLVLEELWRVAETAEPISPEVLVQKSPPFEVDLSKDLYYIRCQGGEGCWGYSLLAIWDIMNEMKCPYSPNLSLNPGLFLHRMRHHWERQGGIYSPEGRFHKKGNYLFNINPNLESDLEKNLISQKLKTEFLIHGFPLPNNAKLVNDIECKWQKRHYLEWGVYDNKWQYLFYIRKENGKLCVYKPIIKWPEISFGATTEGTEITNPTIRWTGWWTEEGVNEAENYRLTSDVKKITVSSSEFMNRLANNQPIQLVDGGHIIAIVGYTAANKTFKFVNSSGDRYGNNGFSTYTFAEIDNKTGKWGNLYNAYIIDPIPPRPVPAARIKVTTPENGGRRININLWLSAEGSPRPKKKIWPPCDSGDNSRNLHYTVRMPSEFIWPPSPNNRLVLDLYDPGVFSETGGALEEFTVAFGGHIIQCSQLSSGPVNFKVREHKRFYVP